MTQALIDQTEALKAILKLADHGRGMTGSPMTALKEIRLIALNAIPLKALREMEEER